MTISKLIKELDSIKKDYGDLEVTVSSHNLTRVDIINASVKSVNPALVFIRDKEVPIKVASISI